MEQFFNYVIDLFTSIDQSHAVFTGIGVIISGIIFLVTTIINVVKSFKKLKEERLKTKTALNALDVLDMIETVCTEVEAEFQKVNATMKDKTGSGAGKQKEEVALSRITEYCKDIGYNYDIDDLRGKIREFINRSKRIS